MFAILALALVSPFLLFCPLLLQDKNLERSMLTKILAGGMIVGVLAGGLLFCMNLLNAKVDSRPPELHKLTAVAERYKDDIDKAQAAFKEKRRIAPSGDYTLKIEHDGKPDNKFELAILVALTQAECLAEDNLTQKDNHYTRHFDGVTKEYADKRGEQFRAAGATVSVEKTAK